MLTSYANYELPLLSGMALFCRAWGETEAVFPKATTYDPRAPGCKFAPRCPFAFEPCSKERPHLYKMDGNRVAACYLYQSGETLAGDNLAELERFSDGKVMVLAIPRGGVVVGMKLIKKYMLPWIS